MQKQLGRWQKAFGRLSFAEELRLAKEVKSRYEQVDDQLFVELSDGLDGHEVPLWAVDDKWFYLRRPEGIWKTRLPKIEAWSAIALCVKKQDSDDSMVSLMGRDFSPSKEWHWGFEGETSPEKRDAYAAMPSAYMRNANEIGTPLVPPVNVEGDKVYFDVGEEFDQEPLLVLDGNWIIGVDSKNPDRRVGFETFNNESLYSFAKDRILWLRFKGDFLPSFDAQVFLPEDLGEHMTALWLLLAHKFWRGADSQKTRAC